LEWNHCRAERFKLSILYNVATLFLWCLI
jgi:hypothetical protein